MAEHNATPAELERQFWKRADDVRAGMLSSADAPPRPMAHTAKAEDKALWFITAAGTDIDEAAMKGAEAHYVLACSHGQIYASVKGRLSLETDKKKIDEIWSPMAAVWFEDGRQDDDIRLVRLAPATADIWLTDGAGKALFEVAKTQVTGDTPDLGEHGRVQF